MHSDLFGELEYNYGWFGKTDLDWYGEKVSIDLFIDCEEDEDIDALQCESYIMFMKAWSRIQESLLDRVLSYYQDRRRELGYSKGGNEDYPEVTDTGGIKKMITPEALLLPYSDIYDGRGVGLAFGCDWNSEDGLGILFVNEEIKEIGYQDVVM